MSQSVSALRVAVACSGLGHTRRGIESWAEDTAGALGRRGIFVTLFGGAPGHAHVSARCLRRNQRATKIIAGVFRRLGGWRYGLGSPYEVEQTTFSLSLWRHVRRGYDILHVQDPLVGRIFDVLHRRGLSQARVIMANGTDESRAKLAGFSVVQELSPDRARRWPKDNPKPRIFMVPNFINLSAFSPGDRTVARERLGLPRDAFIVLCCAAIRRFHKRIDYMLLEFAGFCRLYPGSAMLVIAGGRERDTEELVALGAQQLGDAVRFLVDLPRTEMPDLYRAADVFAFSSLNETFGIVLLEAMASGVPVVCNDTSTFRHIAGPAGEFADLQQEGRLAEALQRMAMPDYRLPHAQAARRHVGANFSEPVVVDRILDMYRRVVAG